MKNRDKVHIIGEKCGAKTRSGAPCKVSKMPNGRCRMHGGKSTGPIDAARPGNKSALIHGIYSDLLRADELLIADSVLAAIGKVDDELLMARFQLRRAFVAQASADATTDGMEVCETIERDGANEYQAKSETKKKLRDYPQIIDKLMARIESLERTRITLLVDKPMSDDDMTRDDTFIAPDEALPDAPIL